MQCKTSFHQDIYGFDIWTNEQLEESYKGLEQHEGE